MRTIFKVSILVFSFAGLAWASNTWESKPYTQWSQKDVWNVLNHSPWVQKTAVRVTWPEPSENDRGRESKGKPADSRRLDVIEARWVSSKVIREALVRQDILWGKMTKEQGEHAVSHVNPAYLMVLFGEDLSPFRKMSDADAAKAAYIEGKETKVKAVAVQAKIERAQNGRVSVVIFAFPRTVAGKPVIGSREKQLDFRLRANRLNVNMMFNTQKMKTKSGLDL